MLFAKKIGAFILLLALMVGGCASTKQTDQSVYKPPVPKPAKTDTSDKKKPEVAQILPIEKTYNVGVILPFYLNELLIEPDSGETYNIEAGKLAIEFYNGITLALDSLEKKGFKANVKIFDDQNDKSRLLDIAHDPFMKNADLVIGPIYNNNLRTLADYARRDSYYVVSPLSPSADISSENPFFIMATPSLEIHCQKIFNHVVKLHPNDNILLFTRADAMEDTYADIFRNLLKQHKLKNNSYGPQFTEINFIPDDAPGNNEFAEFFEVGRRNIVIIPSIDKAFMHGVSRRLYLLNEQSHDPNSSKYLRPDYELKIYGLPAWADDEGLRLDYVNALQIHFTADFWLPENFYAQENNFYQTYLNSFNAEPTQYGIKAFDQMMYFGSLLIHQNPVFEQKLFSQKMKGFHTTFNFGIRHVQTPPSASLDQTPLEPKTDFIENKYVHLLRYQDYSVRKVD